MTAQGRRVHSATVRSIKGSDPISVLRGEPEFTPPARMPTSSPHCAYSRERSWLAPIPTLN